MFLLFLIGLGAAGVKAQVRIGGNAAPNVSAVLDLNANDTGSGNKGLALPRVALTSNQMLLPGVTQNLTGMMVYNTSTTGTGVNTIGIYYWNGATWVRASLPSTSATDSGRYLMSNGTSWVVAPTYSHKGTLDTVNLLLTPPAVTWTKILDTVIAPRQALFPRDTWNVLVVGLKRTDLCVSSGYPYGIIYDSETNLLAMTVVTTISATQAPAVRCYRPSA